MASYTRSSATGVGILCALISMLLFVSTLSIVSRCFNRDLGGFTATKEMI